MTRTKHLGRICNTVVTVGLNLVVQRLGLHPRLRYALWLFIAVNEARGLIVVYEVGDAAFGIL